MKLRRKHMTKGFTLVELLVVIAIIAALAAMATPVILKQKKKADMTEAVNNAKQIYYLMLEFDSEFGSFPSEATQTRLSNETGGSTTYSLNMTNSNGAFLQFFEAGYTKSEEIFYAKSEITRKPDGNIDTTNALAAGEVGFSYVVDQSSSSNSARPLIASPMDPTGTNTFDPDPYDSKAVVLRIDGSVKQLRLKTDNTVTGSIFTTDDLWSGETAEVIHPETTTSP